MTEHFRSLVLMALLCIYQYALADLPDTVSMVKPSIVAVGTYKKTQSPQFSFQGTGFVIGNGNQIATNAHVLPDLVQSDAPELVVLARVSGSSSTLRRAFLIGKDSEHDIAILRIEGSALPPLTIDESNSVREGEEIAFTGFPIGGALGFSPVTHRGIISAVTPIALPGANSNKINEKLITQLKRGSFEIFQLDATAYPGNSGSPAFDPRTGKVIGIINMVFVKGTRESALSSPSGITYAIPAKFLIEALSKLRP